MHEAVETGAVNDDAGRGVDGRRRVDAQIEGTRVETRACEDAIVGEWVCEATCDDLTHLEPFHRRVTASSPMPLSTAVLSSASSATRLITTRRPNVSDGISPRRTHS